MDRESVEKGAQAGDGFDRTRWEMGWHGEGCRQADERRLYKYIHALYVTCRATTAYMSEQATLVVSTHVLSSFNLIFYFELLLHGGVYACATSC